MTPDENRNLLKRAYEGVSRGDPSLLMDAVHDDIVWTIIGSTAFSGVFHGKQEAIEKLLRPLRARLADGPIAFTIERIIAEGDFVVMQATGAATTKTGASYKNVYCIVTRIVDGKILEMKEYVDTELVTAVLGG